MATPGRNILILVVETGDRVEVIPKVREIDLRLKVPGVLMGGIANVRMRVTIETPPFRVDLDGKQVAQAAAGIIQRHLASNFRNGLDAQGTPLRAVSAATVERRARRRRQEFDPVAARADRSKVRGGPNRGRAYPSVDPSTPFHESGLAAENVSTTFKGRDSGDPIFLVALPTGGAERVMNDDGRGARYWAAKHYGLERMMDVPKSADRELDAMMAAHVDDVFRLGGSLVRSAVQTFRRLERAAEQAASGDSDEI